MGIIDRFVDGVAGIISEEVDDEFALGAFNEALDEVVVERLFKEHIVEDAALGS